MSYTSSGSPCGHTFRATGRKYSHTYRKEGVMLLRKVITRPLLEEFADPHTGRYECEDPDTVTMGKETFSFNVFYSINKRERWLYPSLIETDLRQCYPRPRFLPDIHIETSCRTHSIEFVQRYKLHTNKSTIALGSWDSGTDDVDDRWVTQRHLAVGGCCQGDNMFQTQPVFSRRTRRDLFLRDDPYNWELVRKPNEHQAGVENEIEETETQDVRIEVLVPSEDPANIRKLKPKHLGIDTKKYFTCGNYIRRPYLHTGYKFRRGFMRERQKMYKDMNDCGGDEDLIASDSDAEHVHETYTTEIQPPARPPVTLYDFVNVHLKQAEAPKSRKRNIVNEAKDTIGPKTVSYNSVHLENEYTEPDMERSKSDIKCQEREETMQPSLPSWFNKEGSDFGNYRKNVKPVIVTLNKAHTQPEQLSREYGERYIECHCTPRRFLIDISEDIIGAKGCNNKKQFRAFGWAVFDEDTRTLSNNMQSYQVSLNIKHSSRDPCLLTHLDTIKDNSKIHLRKALDLAVEYIKCHIEEFDVQIVTDDGALQESLPRSYLHKTAHWVFKSYIPSDSFFMEMLFSSQSSLRDNTRHCLRSRENSRSHGQHVQQNGPLSKQQTEPQSSNTLVTTETTTQCDICLLIMEYTSCQTKLNGCGHTFCNSCWVTYLENMTKHTFGPLTCPYLNCSEKVDIGTLLSLVNVGDCLRYARVKHDKEVEADRYRRWCRQPRCGRVLVRSCVDVAEVRCPCGDICCFDCSAKPHWPLSCGGYADYSLSVLDRGKLVSPPNFTVKFDSRICRLCYGVIRKYDRCEIAKCLCNSKLCPMCSAYWHRKHGRYDEELQLSPEQTSINFKILAGDLDLFSVAKLHKWTAFITQHRLQQHPFRTQKMISLTKPLTQKIKSHLLREGRNGAPILNFEVGAQNFFNEVAKAESFIEYFVDMYSELNSILEHAGVMLDVDQIGHHKAVLQHYVLKLSNNTKLILSLFREANIQRPARLLVMLKDLRISSDHLLYCLVNTVKETNT